MFGDYDSFASNVDFSGVSSRIQLACLPYSMTVTQSPKSVPGHLINRGQDDLAGAAMALSWPPDGLVS